MACYLSFVKKKEKKEADILTKRRNHSLNILNYPALIAIYYYNFTCIIIIDWLYINYYI